MEVSMNRQQEALRLVEEVVKAFDSHMYPSSYECQLADKLRRAAFMLLLPRSNYGSFVNEEGEEYGSFEVFYEDQVGKGWYWWACWPGCLPDGEAIGPFETEEEAVQDARLGQ